MTSIRAAAVKIYPCPLPDCQFAIVGELPGPAESDGALAEVVGAAVPAALADGPEGDPERGVGRVGQRPRRWHGGPPGRPMDAAVRAVARQVPTGGPS